MATYTLPARWASALINDDWSGLEQDDAEHLRRWLGAERPGQCLACTDQPFFSHRHDAWSVSPLADECLEFSFGKKRRAEAARKTTT